MIDYERLALLRMRRYLVRLFTLSKMAAVNKRKRCNEVLEAMKANDSASEDDVLNENEENYVERGNDTDNSSREDESELFEQKAKKVLKKKGRKSNWPGNSVNELIDVVCENEYYRKKLIFTNNKSTKNAEVYQKVLKDVQARFAERGEVFEFNVVQARTKFKSCVSICKKAAMLQRQPQA